MPRSAVWQLIARNSALDTANYPVPTYIMPYNRMCVAFQLLCEGGATRIHIPGAATPSPCVVITTATLGWAGAII